MTTDCPTRSLCEISEQWRLGRLDHRDFDQRYCRNQSGCRHRFDRDQLLRLLARNSRSAESRSAWDQAVAVRLPNDRRFDYRMRRCQSNRLQTFRNEQVNCKSPLRICHCRTVVLNRFGSAKFIQTVKDHFTTIVKDNGNRNDGIGKRLTLNRYVSGEHQSGAIRIGCRCKPADNRGLSFTDIVDRVMTINTSRGVRKLSPLTS